MSLKSNFKYMSSLINHKKYFICIPLRETVIDDKMLKFRDYYNITNKGCWDPHISLIGFSCQDYLLDNIIQYINLIANELKDKRYEIEVKGLCCLVKLNEKTNIMVKKKLHKTGGQILANVIETNDIRYLVKKFYNLPISSIDGIKIIFKQKNLHVTFEGSKGNLKNNNILESLLNVKESEIAFGAINIKEIWLCEFKANKGSGYYKIHHKVSISDKITI